MQNLVETPGDFSDLLYRQTVVNVPALEMRGKIRRLSGKISMKFAILSMHKTLPTFRSIVSDRATRGKPPETPGKFAILSMHKPLPAFHA